MVKRLGYLLLLLFAFVSYSPNQLRAEEPASQFLQELRNQRYFELAEYYLDLQVGKEMPVSYTHLTLPTKRIV